MMALCVVNFDAIDLSGGRVDHFVSVALERALCKDYFPLELFTVVAEAQILRLMTILDLQ